MQLFDSHCHLDDESYSHDIEEVLDRAAAAGVVAMMVAGVNRASSLQAVSLSQKNDKIYASVGIHPHDAGSCSVDTLEALAALARANSSVRAWGETGLDFNRMHAAREEQIECFVRQVRLADELGLPLIFHERDSGGRFLELVQQHHRQAGNGVIHCFSGNRQELSQYVAMGYYIGVTGIVTMQKRGASLRRMIGDIPENRLLIETDAPYLTPAPVKNKTRRNEPCFVGYTLRCLAEILEKDPVQLAGQVMANTCRLFRIDKKKRLTPGPPG